MRARLGGSRSTARTVHGAESADVFEVASQSAATFECQEGPSCSLSEVPGIETRCSEESVASLRPLPRVTPGPRAQRERSRQRVWVPPLPLSVPCRHHVDVLGRSARRVIADRHAPLRLVGVSGPRLHRAPTAERQLWAPCSHTDRQLREEGRGGQWKTSGAG